jgi:hypothetical protein
MRYEIRYLGRQEGCSEVPCALVSLGNRLYDEPHYNSRLTRNIHTSYQKQVCFFRESNACSQPASKSGPVECWFLITDDLISALRTLRDKDTKVRLWVDAICINQDPTNDRSRKEKEQQIGNMAQISTQRMVSAYGLAIAVQQLI